VSQAPGHRELAVTCEQLAELVELLRLHHASSAVDDRSVVSHNAAPLKAATRGGGRRIAARSTDGASSTPIRLHLRAPRDGRGSSVPSEREPRGATGVYMQVPLLQWRDEQSLLFPQGLALGQGAHAGGWQTPAAQT
jgi:hypothetical protein